MRGGVACYSTRVLSLPAGTPRISLSRKSACVASVLQRMPHLNDRARVHVDNWGRSSALAGSACCGGSSRPAGVSLPRWNEPKPSRRVRESG